MAIQLNNELNTPHLQAHVHLQSMSQIRRTTTIERALVPETMAVAVTPRLIVVWEVA